MPRQPRAFTIVNHDGTAIYRDLTHDFAPVPPLAHDEDQVRLPQSAWVGYYAESQSKLAAVRKTLDADAHLLQIDDGEE